MSTTALTNIQEIIERSLFERIRLELVDKLYLPDVSDIITYPDNQTGWDQWKTDVKAIADGDKGFAIELFSCGNNEAKGIKKVPRIVIESGNFLPGSLGGDPQRYFSEQTLTYKGLVTPSQTVDFYINFHLVSKSIAQIRILNSILALAVSRRGYIPWYSDADKSFFARYINYYDQGDESMGVTEHVYAYEVPDAWDREDIEVYATIAKMSEITLNTNIQKYMDRTWGFDSDPLIIT